MKIKLLVLDVDGCMSDGKITYTSSGDEIKSFNVKDGLAIASWIRLGGKVAIITGRKSTIVERRANELNINYIYQNIKDKKSKLDEILKIENLQLAQVASIGDDLNDYAMLKNSGWSFSPQNGVDDITNMVDTVLDKSGGEGAVRQMIEMIIRKNGNYEEFLKLWY